MTLVVFYEKPGCLTNARQKTLLRSSGCQLTVRNLLTESWTEARLYAFLADLPVPDWFNISAPKIKSGAIDPAKQDRACAMALLLGDPLLIRRPLLDTEFGKTAGFDNVDILTSLGVRTDVSIIHQSCSKPDDASACPEPGQNHA